MGFRVGERLGVGACRVLGVSVFAGVSACVERHVFAGVGGVMLRWSAVRVGVRGWGGVG